MFIVGGLFMLFTGAAVIGAVFLVLGLILEAAKKIDRD